MTTRQEKAPTCPQDLLETLIQLRREVVAEGAATLQQWKPEIHRRNFAYSARNLACYLALRRRDLRPLQVALMPWGLSSLGRSEARVTPSLDAVIASLAAVCRREGPEIPARPSAQAFFRGDHLLERNAAELLGPPPRTRRTRILVTLPSEAAEEYAFVRGLLERGADCVRINCAHDAPDAWAAMCDHVRRAEEETGRCCRILMDLAGPKARTGEVLSEDPKRRMAPGDLLLLTRDAPSNAAAPFQAACALPEILDQLTVGDAIFMDDGRLSGKVETIGPEGVWVRITHTRPKGEKLKPDRSLNFPHVPLHLNPLTDKDRRDLAFVVQHADIIGYSYVQKAGDLRLLQRELKRCQGETERTPALIAKIETPRAVSSLPELIVQGAGEQPFGVMIARGDLAIEVGYERLAEMQEELLWICEAAHAPVIWATQVLESLVKTGSPSRAEITDAAMSERAECVMLNKGPFLTQAITVLEDVLTRMEAHQLKKTPRLRALHSW